ncbi:uncharacterized protein LOC128506382 [Scomber scombrus]|uniref:Uncharacterized protein LOC128506382 n=1 Tax=Scomber scombrus TaxID=13677 RepID=A0AAV1QB98_SCOSC
MKSVVLLEPTVLWESHLEDVFERKLSKYVGLIGNRQQAGWRARCAASPLSLTRACTSLGIVGEMKRRNHPKSNRSGGEGFKMAAAQKRRAMASR